MNSTRQTTPTQATPFTCALTSCLIGLLLLSTLALLLQQLFGMSMRFVAWTLAAFLLGAMVLLERVHEQPQLACFGAANQVTLARAALVTLLFGLLAESTTVAHAWLAVGAAMLTITLDGVDGWIARQYGLSSAFGARFDMETDALLILALSLLVWHYDKAGAWVLLSGLLRYLFVAAAYVLTWLRRPLPPSRRRQTVCVLQILTLVVCLLPLVKMPWSQAMAALGILLLVWSFAVDIIWLARRAGTKPEESHS